MSDTRWRDVVSEFTRNAILNRQPGRTFCSVATTLHWRKKIFENVLLAHTRANVFFSLHLFTRCTCCILIYYSFITLYIIFIKTHCYYYQDIFSLDYISIANLMILCRVTIFQVKFHGLLQFGQKRETSSFSRSWETPTTRVRHLLTRCLRSSWKPLENRARDFLTFEWSTFISKTFTRSRLYSWNSNKGNHSNRTLSDLFPNVKRFLEESHHPMTTGEDEDAANPSAETDRKYGFGRCVF